MPPKRKAAGSAAPKSAAQNKASKTQPNATASGSPSQQESDTAATSKPAWEILYESRVKDRRLRWAPVSASKNLDEEHMEIFKDPKHAYEFMCFCNPIKGTPDEEDEGNPSAGRAGGKGKCDAGKTCPCGKTAVSLPSHQYTMTRSGKRRYETAGHMVDLRNPDTFDMYTFNDHTSYGVVEVVQNMLVDFEDARVNELWAEAWSVVEGMALFMMVGEGGMMGMVDDGEMAAQTAAQIVRMVMAALAWLEAEGKLGQDSDVKNVPWLLQLYQKVASQWRDSSLLEEASPAKPKTFKFQADNFDLYLQSYAHRLGITLPGQSDVPANPDITMPKPDGKDPWGWNKSFKEYTKSVTPVAMAGGKKPRVSIGGDALDITTWTSAERKSHSFDKKDPLPKDLTKKLKEGLVFVLQ